MLFSDDEDVARAKYELRREKYLELLDRQDKTSAIKLLAAENIASNPHRQSWLSMARYEPVPISASHPQTYC